MGTMKHILILAACIAAQSALHGEEVAMWNAMELSWETQKEYANPFTDVEVDAVFTLGEKKWVMPAFWAGGRKWTVRFAPPMLGEYKCRVECTDRANNDLNGKERTFSAVEYRGDNPLLKHGFLRVSADKRHFAHADGTPFFWLGDTWWKGLCKRLTWDGFQELTADRKAKGFSVVQIVCGRYPDEGGFEARWENEGGKPYLNRDFTVLNPAYFEYADRRIRYLLNAGIVPAIVGGWGRPDCNSLEAGVANIKRHWRNLVAHYGAYPTVWIIGGESGGPQWTEIAAYVQRIDPYGRPVSIHPFDSGRKAVTDESVINFDMLQTGHGDWDAARGAIPKLTVACARTPPMPVMIGEYCYEGHMQTAFQDVQRYVFWCTMLSGAAGLTYGAAGVWHMGVENDPGITPIYDWTTWKEGMNAPGSMQIGLGKKLLEQYPWARLEPHPEWTEPGSFAAGIPGELRFIYQPRRTVYNWSGTTVKQIERDVPYHAFYFNPWNGNRHDLGTFVNAGPGRRPFEGHTMPLLSSNRFDGTDSSVWKDHGTPTTRSEGRLVGGKGTVTVLETINEADLMASVQARNDAEAGIILRFHDPGHYLVALYTPSLKAIYLHDRKNGEWGEPLGKVNVPDIGPNIQLTAAACGEYAAMILTDGTNTFYTPIVKVANTTPGKAGLWLFQIGEKQEFSRFEVSRARFVPEKNAAGNQGHRMIPSDTYQTAAVPSPQDWVLVLQRAAGVDDFAARTYDDGKGHKLPFRLFVPRGYDENKQYPLILYLHGAGGRGTDNAQQLIDVNQAMVFAEPANQRQRPCFILAPQCPSDAQWAAMPWGEPAGTGKFAAVTWPMEASLALLDGLTREYRGIDKKQLCVIGPSMGGYGTWDAVCRFPDRFRTAVPICGGGDPAKLAQLAALKHLRLWAYHCADDPAVPVGRSREMITALRSLNGLTPRYTEFPDGGHDAYSRALTDHNLHEWLFDSAGGQADDTTR